MSKRITRANPKHPRAHWIEPLVAVMVVLLVAAIIFMSTSALAQRLDRQTLQVWFFDIGQGDATLIVTPEGKQILIDAGRDKAVLSKLGSILPPWDRTLDAIVITHPDADHISGFVEVLKRYDVKMVITTGASAYTAVVEALEEAIKNEKTQVVLVEQGDRLIFGEVLLDVLWPDRSLAGEVPEDRNHYSVVLRLSYGDTTVLLTGDAEVEAELGFRDLAGDIDVLKVGHHGSITSTTQGLLEITQPEHAVVSVGENNRYGHPHPVIVERVESIGAQIYRTDLEGDVLLTSTGGEPSVQPYPLSF